MQTKQGTQASPMLLTFYPITTCLAQSLGANLICLCFKGQELPPHQIIYIEIAEALIQLADHSPFQPLANALDDFLGATLRLFAL